MVGAVLFTDPQEDGEIIEANGYKPYPGWFFVAELVLGSSSTDNK